MKRLLSNTNLLALAVFAMLAWTIWGDGYLASCTLSPDGVAYLRMAESAAHGHPFNPNGISGHPGWFARWPVGYPWCIALVSWASGLDAFTSARVLATLMVGALLCLLMLRARPAFPVLALCLLNLSFTGIVRGTYSEQPYILALTAICFALSGGCGRWRTALTLAPLCMAAFLFRYVGAFALVWTVAAAALTVRFGRAGRSTLHGAVVAAFAAAAFVAGYLVMNQAMCGSFTGGHPPGAPESFLALARRLCIALLNETQVFFFASAWAAALFFAAGPGSFCGRKADAKADATPDGFAFIAYGLLCNATVILLRFVMPFDTLGLRLLCPGTTLIAIGTILFLRKRLGVDWAAALDAAPTRRLMAFLALAVLPAANFSSMDGEMRRIMRLPKDPMHDAYRTVRARVMEKYADTAPGTRFSFPDSRPGEDFWIDFLRPDILADVPDSPDKGF